MSRDKNQTPQYTGLNKQQKNPQQNIKCKVIILK